MKKIELGNGCVLHIPESYEKKPIKGKAEWVKALTSGAYNQGGHLLGSVNKKINQSWFCCLGVYCELYIDPSEQGRMADNSDSYVKSYRGASHSLPDSLACDSGIGSKRGSISPCHVWRKRESVYYSLASMNDEGMTFEQIATVIDHVFCEKETTRKELK